MQTGDPGLQGILTLKPHRTNVAVVLMLLGLAAASSATVRSGRTVFTISMKPAGQSRSSTLCLLKAVAGWMGFGGRLGEALQLEVQVGRFLNLAQNTITTSCVHTSFCLVVHIRCLVPRELQGRLSKQ